MRKALILFVLLFSSSYAFSQGPEPRQFDEFQRVPCGDMMGRLDALLYEWTKNKDDRIVVMYYGHRYRKSTIIGKNDEPAGTALSYAHRDDGLNWAKGIPKYLIARVSFSEENGAVKNKDLLEKLRESVVLINAGYREDLLAQIWLVPSQSENPKPAIYLAESQIKFGAKEPRPVPDYYNCYAGH